MAPLSTKTARTFSPGSLAPKTLAAAGTSNCRRGAHGQGASSPANLSGTTTRTPPLCLAPCPILLYTGSPCQLSLLARVDLAFFLVRVCCLPHGTSLRFARAKECSVGTIDKDRAASLAVLTGTPRPSLLPASVVASNCPCYYIAVPALPRFVPFLRSRLPSGFGLKAWSSMILLWENTVHGSSVSLTVEIVPGGHTRMLNARLLPCCSGVGPYKSRSWCSSAVEGADVPSGYEFTFIPCARRLAFVGCLATSCLQPAQRTNVFVCTRRADICPPLAYPCWR
ncbi:hypothetical protein MTO96_025358 [Rhipicephalus appendiculatus]